MPYIVVNRNLAAHPSKWVRADTFTDARLYAEMEYSRTATLGESQEYIILDEVWFNSGANLLTIHAEGCWGFHPDWTETKSILTPIRAKLRSHQSMLISLSYLPNGEWGDCPTELWEFDVVDDTTPIFNSLVHSINAEHNAGS